MAENQDLAKIQKLAKIHDSELSDKLAEILDKYSVKYHRASVKWGIKSDDSQLTDAINEAIPDSTLSKTHIIFLEEGNSRAGLEHISTRDITMTSKPKQVLTLNKK